MSYILNMLICVGMILLDNLLQYLLFIAMIDLSRTYDSIARLMYNALLMFMIYSWIKIKLKVLIFSTTAAASQPSPLRSMVMSPTDALSGWPRIAPAVMMFDTMSTTSLRLCRGEQGAYHDLAHSAQGHGAGGP
jgi:hypothetical protein